MFDICLVFSPMENWDNKERFEGETTSGVLDNKARFDQLFSQIADYYRVIFAFQG